VVCASVVQVLGGVACTALQGIFHELSSLHLSNFKESFSAAIVDSGTRAVLLRNGNSTASLQCCRFLCVVVLTDHTVRSVSDLCIY
jgi:hypothetical protein